MATLLYKIGRFAFRHRWYVILTWLAVLVVVGMSSATASAPPPDKFTMPGTESQKAFDLMDKRFPSASADGATAKVVFKARNGEKITDGSNRAAVGQVLDKLKGKQVSQVSDPLAPETVSKDGSTAYASVTYKVPGGEIADATRDEVAAAAKSGRGAGITVEIGGDVVKSGSPPSSEGIGIAIAAVILVITFGSLVAAGCHCSPR